MNNSDKSPTPPKQRGRPKGTGKGPLKLRAHDLLVTDAEWAEIMACGGSSWVRALVIKQIEKP